ncbi:MAG TPA: hypothetical protein VM146_16565 [Steroidobacteraceae bacterium]|nr:hypothetical protein [Steroidobacteraceae bacterium]
MRTWILGALCAATVMVAACDPHAGRADEKSEAGDSADDAGYPGQTVKSEDKAAGSDAAGSPGTPPEQSGSSDRKADEQASNPPAPGG